jgi:uncharacterized protein (DUF3084 family)
MDAVKLQVQSLEKDLSSAYNTQWELRASLEKVKEEKARLVKESQAMESKYLDELEMRDTSIAALEGNVANLEQLIIDKDRIIRSQSEQLDKYKTSMRQVIRLGFSVTGNKIRQVGRPFRRLIKKSDASGDDV